MDFSPVIARIKELKKHYLDYPLIFADIDKVDYGTLTQDVGGKYHLALKGLDFKVGKAVFVYKSNSKENYKNDKNDILDCLTYI